MLNRFFVDASAKYSYQFFYFLLFTSAYITRYLSFFFNNFLVENFIQKYLEKGFCCKFTIFNRFTQTLSPLWQKFFVDAPFSKKHAALSCACNVNQQHLFLLVLLHFRTPLIMLIKNHMVRKWLCSSRVSLWWFFRIFWELMEMNNFVSVDFQTQISISFFISMEFCTRIISKKEGVWRCSSTIFPPNFLFDFFWMKIAQLITA